MKKRRYIYAISAGHAFTDLSQGALPAMLPFIVVAGGLNYAQAAGLTFAIAFSATLTQPIFGIVADKLSKTWFLPLGVLLSGFVLSLIGFFPDNYWIMFTIAIISGVGVAAYHPEGARMVNGLAGENKGSSMSLFSLGGTVGFSLGPLLATPALLYFGLRGSGVLAIPAIAMCTILFILYPRMRNLVEVQEREDKKTMGERKNEWLKFSWLGVGITCRSIISHSVLTFIPLYWMNVLHQSKAASGMIVSYITLIGAVAIVLSGHLADKFGMNKIIKTSWMLLIPSIFLLTRTSNPFLAMLILVPIAVGLFALNAPMIVLGQQYLPKNVGFASGITLGLGVSIGGIAAPILGSYADIHGLVSTFQLLSVLPVIGLVVAFTSRPPAR